MMKFRVLVLPILVAVGCVSYHIPDCKIDKPQLECNNMNRSIISGDCVAVVPRATHLIHRTRTDPSLSSEPASGPYGKSENSTTSNSTLPTQQASLNGPSWMPKLEGIITLMFRTVILLLTLFNINITWRIHGK